MKSLLTALITLPILLFSTWIATAAVPTSPPAPAKPTLFVCGDSTSKFSGSEKPTDDMQGWGTPIAQFFDSDKVKVNNVGHAGTSSRSYYTGDWPRVIAQVKPGDLVLIVFGINDGTTPNGTGDEVNAQGVHTYGWYMSKMATETRDKGARPFFLTVTTRNIWTNANPAIKYKDATSVGPDGNTPVPLPPDYDPKLDKIERGTGNGRYTQWTKDVGKKINVPVFDLTNYCADVYEKMGREEVNKLYRDHNHTHAPGALIVATCITSGIKSFKDSPFVPLLSEKGKALPTADAKFISDNIPDPNAPTPAATTTQP